MIRRPASCRHSAASSGVSVVAEDSSTATSNLSATTMSVAAPLAPTLFESECLGLGSDQPAQPVIQFEEFRFAGYAGRTRENAKADVTIAVARNFFTAGEKLTRRVVEEAGKAFIPVPYGVTEQLETVSMVVAKLNEAGARLGRVGITLNIAGNGLYTLKEPEQERVDERVFLFLKSVVEHPDLRVGILWVRSGGQTGVDEAGVKAAAALGIPAKVTAPKGWVFRGADGKDVADEAAFKARFGEQGA